MTSNGYTEFGGCAGAVSSQQRAATILKVPVVFARNRQRGLHTGAMIEDDLGESMNPLRAALREEAAIAGVEPTLEWQNTCISQLLRLYEQAQSNWESGEEGTVGHVYEAVLPSGRTILFGSAAVLARVGVRTAA
jgi:hypothetical protein